MFPFLKHELTRLFAGGQWWVNYAVNISRNVQTVICQFGLDRRDSFDRVVYPEVVPGKCWAMAAFRSSHFLLWPFINSVSRRMHIRYHLGFMPSMEGVFPHARQDDGFVARLRREGSSLIPRSWPTAQAPPLSNALMPSTQDWVWQGRGLPLPLGMEAAWQTQP